MEVEDLLEFIFNGIMIMVINLLGIVGNGMSFYVLYSSNSRKRDTFYNLLCWLTVIDTLYLLFSILSFSLVSMSTFYEEAIFPYLVPALAPLLSIFLVGSIYCIVALCVERYLTIKGHFYKNQGAFLGYILPVMAFSIIYNIPKFFEMETIQDEITELAVAQPTEFKLSPDYVYILVSSSVCTGLLPAVTIIVLNIMINYTQKKTNTYHQSNSLLHVMAVVFLVCHLPRFVITVYEIAQLLGAPIPLVHFWVIDLSHVFLSIGSAINLPILTVKDPVFRESMIISSPSCINRLLFKIHKDDETQEEDTQENLLRPSIQLRELKELKV